MTEYQIYRKVLECVRKNPQLCKFLKSHKALHNFVKGRVRIILTYNLGFDSRFEPKIYKKHYIFYFISWKDKQGYEYWFNLHKLYQLYLHERNL